MEPVKFEVGHRVKTTNTGGVGTVKWVGRTPHAKFGYTYGVWFDNQTGKKEHVVSGFLLTQA